MLFISNVFVNFRAYKAALLLQCRHALLLHGLNNEVIEGLLRERIDKAWALQGLNCFNQIEVRAELWRLWPPLVRNGGIFCFRLGFFLCFFLVFSYFSFVARLSRRLALLSHLLVYRRWLVLSARDALIPFFLVVLRCLTLLWLFREG